MVSMRVAGEADAEQITELINSAFRQVESFFIDGDRIGLDEVVASLRVGTFMVAEDGNKLLGCVYLEPGKERAYLGLLSVDPLLQHAGLGSKILSAAEDHCAALGCRFMDLKVVNLRTELPAYYRRRGYVETGTSPLPEGLETKLPCCFIEMSKTLRG